VSKDNNCFSLLQRGSDREPLLHICIWLYHYMLNLFQISHVEASFSCSFSLQVHWLVICLVCQQSTKKMMRTFKPKNRSSKITLALKVLIHHILLSLYI
jgi:hypothetical protein